MKQARHYIIEGIPRHEQASCPAGAHPASNHLYTPGIWSPFTRKCMAAP